MIADVYGRGYTSGMRLRAHLSALIDVIRSPDLSIFPLDIQQRGHSYIHGFTDGWHARQPKHPPLPER